MLTYFTLFFQLLLVLLGICILSEDRIGVRLFVFMFLIAQGLGYLLYATMGYVGTFFLLFFIILCLFLKTKKILTSIIISCITAVIFVLSDYITEVIVANLFEKSVESLRLEPYYLILITMAHFIPAVMLYLLVRYMFNRLQVYRFLEGRYGKVVIVFLALTLIIFFVNVFIGQQQGFSHENIHINSILFLIYGCLLFGVFIALTYIVIKDSNMERERIQNQRLQEYTTQLEQLYENISSFRHDYINVLLTLEEGIRSEDIQVIKGIYEKVVKPTKEIMKSNQYSFATLRNLQVNEVKSILAAKMIKAQAQEIDVQLEIEEVIDVIYMDLVDFCRVFSILMDNAIEAAPESQQPHVSIAFIQDYQIQRIMIENSCLDQNINSQDIFKKGHSSKGKNRGIGLYNVKQLLNKNRYAAIETFYESGIFMQTLILKKKEE